MKFTYISLLLLSLAYPLFKSFENKILFYKKWKFLFPALFSSALIFIAWDVWFTNISIWKFNPKYILGFYILNLPIEEWLFFIIIPFSCTFIYEVMNYFVNKNILEKQNKYITLILAIALFIIALFNYTLLYTSITFFLLSIFLFAHQFILKSNFLGRFYIAFLVCIIPFTIVNGVLTYLPVLIYNDTQNLGIRIYTIPIEDLFYGMLNFLLVITIYEWLKQKI